MKILLLVIVLAVSGCAKLIETSDSLGGIQDGPKWGIVEYGPGTKEKAIEIMQEYCRPINYKILSVTHGDRSILAKTRSLNGETLRTKFECLKSDKQ